MPHRSAVCTSRNAASALPRATAKRVRNSPSAMSKQVQTQRPRGANPRGASAVGINSARRAKQRAALNSSGEQPFAQPGFGRRIAREPYRGKAVANDSDTPADAALRIVVTRDIIAVEQKRAVDPRHQRVVDRRGSSGAEEHARSIASDQRDTGERQDSEQRTQGVAQRERLAVGGVPERRKPPWKLGPRHADCRVLQLRLLRRRTARRCGECIDAERAVAA